MKIYDAQNLEEAPRGCWERLPGAEHFLHRLVQEGPGLFTSDRALMRLVEVDNVLIPLAIHDTDFENSGHCSPYARYITATRSSLTQVAGRLQATVGGTLIDGLGILCRLGRLNRVVSIDNWMVIRNLAVERLQREALAELTRGLIQAFPTHTLLFSGLNPAQHADQLEALHSLGYQLLFSGHTRLDLPFGMQASRQERENHRRDVRLLETAGYTLMDARALDDGTPALADRLAALHRQLNRGKHETNPDMREALFRLSMQEGLFHFKVAVKDGRVDGFYGFMHPGDTVLGPLFGYDTDLPQSVGLYRFLVAHLKEEAWTRGLAIETGRGADQFKSLRGDRPVGRYDLVYTAHLPVHQRTAWKLVGVGANGPLRNGVRGWLKRIDGPQPEDFGRLEPPFSSPLPSPGEAVRQLRERLDGLEARLEACAAGEDARSGETLLELTDLLHNWPRPTARVKGLLNRLAEVQRGIRRAQAGRAEAQEGELLAGLEAQAEKLAGVSVVIAQVGVTDRARLQGLAEGLLARGNGVVLLGSVGEAGRLILVGAVGETGLARGVKAGELVKAASAAVGGGGGGKERLAWGGGRGGSLEAALEAAREALLTQLGKGPGPEHGRTLSAQKD